MPKVHPALEKVWRDARQHHADIVKQPLPVRLLVLLCELREKERVLANIQLKPGDIVRLKVGSKDMIVSDVLDLDTIECTFFDGDRQFTTTVAAADVVKVHVPSEQNLPSPSN